MPAKTLFRLVLAVSIALLPVWAFAAQDKPPAKPGPDEVMKRLAAGNARFVAGKSQNADQKRPAQAGGKEGPTGYALATVLACSDPRVPLERLFDAGPLELFTVRVAGNVCNTDEAGSIEYGLSQLRTPVLVILGHTQCLAVATVTDSLAGRGRTLERNVAPLLAPIAPAARRAMDLGRGLSGEVLLLRAVEENVWQAVEDLFVKSPAVRELYKAKSVKIVGGVYDVGTGKVTFLPEAKIAQILKEAEANPARAMNALAEPGQEAKAADSVEIDKEIREISRNLQGMDGRFKDVGKEMLPALQALQGRIEERAERQHRELLLAVAALAGVVVLLFLVLWRVVAVRTRKLAAQQERQRAKPRPAPAQPEEKIMQFRDQ
jgi:carbonic anhydrase